MGQELSTLCKDIRNDEKESGDHEYTFLEIHLRSNQTTPINKRDKKLEASISFFFPVATEAR